MDEKIDQADPFDAMSDDEIVALMGEVPDDTAPRAMSLQEIIHKGDTALPAPMWISALKEAGWVPLYHVATRERSLVSRNTAPAKLKEIDPDTGKPAWTLRKPAQPAWRGTFHCLLRPDSPSRAEFDRMGFPVCKKSNIPNELHQQLHMQHRHPMVYKLLTARAEREEKDADRAERQAEREHQRALLEGLVAGRAITAFAPAPPTVTANIVATVSGGCPQCDTQFTASTTGGLANKIRLHARAKHKE